jgi:hypothetical protein
LEVLGCLLPPPTGLAHRGRDAVETKTFSE